MHALRSRNRGFGTSTDKTSFFFRPKLPLSTDRVFFFFSPSTAVIDGQGFFFFFFFFSFFYPPFPRQQLPSLMLPLQCVATTTTVRSTATATPSSRGCLGFWCYGCCVIVVVALAWRWNGKWGCNYFAHRSFFVVKELQQRESQPQPKKIIATCTSRLLQQIQFLKVKRSAWFILPLSSRKFLNSLWWCCCC